MRCLRWSRLAAVGLVLLVAAPEGRPQNIIANICNTAGGWCLLPPGTIVQITRPCRCFTTDGLAADGRTPHAPAPQRPTVTP